MARVAINGLGRIGRATLKQLMDNPDLELVAVNDLVPPENLAYLLRHDTVYGPYKEPVKAEGGSLKVGGRRIDMLNQKSPAELPWKSMNVDIVFECTGLFTKREDMQKHLDAGAKLVILSAPSKSDDVDTVVFGVNEPREDARMFSCASCTTNCIAPVAEIMQRRVGVKKAVMTTIHAYTSSQQIVDAPAKKWTRGRAGAANLVPTSTGAAQATARALPAYEGIFDGVAVRAPVPIGSVSDLSFVTSRRTSVQEINDMFAEEAVTRRYGGILGVSDDPLVSSDIIKDPRASVVDLPSTVVVDGDLVKVMSWYDNEWGYAAQMIRSAVAATKRQAALV